MISALNARACQMFARDKYNVTSSPGTHDLAAQVVALGSRHGPPVKRFGDGVAGAHRLRSGADQRLCRREQTSWELASGRMSDL
jgi:hypothetical protein